MEYAVTNPNNMCELLDNLPIYTSKNSDAERHTDCLPPDFNNPYDLNFII